MKIKICGITTLETATAAVEAGVDWIGFVFSESPRKVTPEAARSIARALPENQSIVAVFRNPSREYVEQVIEIVKPDWVQTDVADFSGLGDLDSCRPLPVYRPNTLQAWSETSPPAIALFEGPVSGSGETTDWTLAASLAARTCLILAGGLTAQNVSDAIQRVRPYGVDVSSGVERAPGKKDADKITQFVRAARNAANDMEHNA